MLTKEGKLPSTVLRILKAKFDYWKGAQQRAEMADFFRFVYTIAANL